MRLLTHPENYPRPIIGIMTTVMLFSVLAGCAGRNPMTIYRPNARTPLEERSYNALKVADRMIQEAERSNAAGTLPEFMRPIVNALIDVYELTLTAAEGYVAVIGTAEEEERAAALVDLMLDLDAQITKMFERGGGP